MINPSFTNPIWLAPDEAIPRAFNMALADIRHRVAISIKYVKGAHKKAVLDALNDVGPATFGRLTKIQVEELLNCCFRNTQDTLEDRLAIVESIIPGFPADKFHQLCTLLKLTFMRLWMEKQVILPLGYSAPIHCDDIIDKLILDVADQSGYGFLAHVRAINPTSSLAYTGALNLKQRELRATHWFRLTLASNLFSASSMTAETARDLKLRSYGARSQLARFYTDDFSVYAAEKSQNPWLRDSVHKVMRQSTDELKAAQKREQVTEKEKNKNTLFKKHTAKALEYLEGANHSLNGLATVFNDLKVMNKAFRIDSGEDLPAGLALLPKKVTSFCRLVNSTFHAFLRAKRLERTSNYSASLYILMAYCGPYLYRFFMDRDGNLNDYPMTLNDFSCSLFVTADRDFIRELGAFEKEPPETLLEFLEILVDINEWTPETHYHRVYPYEGLFDYISANSDIIPNSDKVRNSFSPDCYPRSKRRWGTAKKPVPRSYFATFVSMLDSLEYLAMHLNDMADSASMLNDLHATNGVCAGVLKRPNMSELNHSSDWAGIWGTKGTSCEALDLSALSYCPIFYHEGKPTPFQYIPRLHRISDMHINGIVEPRVIMNDVRMAQLMCETGIRQQHLLWLDKDRYDRYVDRSGRRPLAPLLVSTDKAHGEWTSIVSTKVIDILDRQRSWYKRCTSPDFKLKMGYNKNKDSKFGSFRPLFRLPLNLSHWANYHAFRLFLLCLQYFIKEELGDFSTPDLVWQKQSRRKYNDDEPLYINDHSIAKLSMITAGNLTGDITPHGLRAGFVSEAIKFLPPSIVGRYLTGQSEPLVHYYTVFDEGDLALSHQELLCRALLQNQDKLTAGDFPQLAEAIDGINRKIQQDIASDPQAAIGKHRLMSLSNVKREKGNGLDRIIAKEVTELAFNATHICPFNNICPREVIDLFGEPQNCSACPYAIRGIAHLPAISARKDKYKELMVSSLRIIDQYMMRKPKAQNRTELDSMNIENDRFAREACLLEAIETQLMTMADQGQDEDLMVKNREEIVGHYQRLSLPEEERLLKRLVDVQNFPDASSEDLSMRLAHLRHVLLMREGNLESLLGINENDAIPLSSKVAMQISTMVKSGAIDVMDVYEASTGGHEALRRLSGAANGQLLLTQLAG